MYKTTGNTAIGKSRRKFETIERIRANAVGLTAFNGGDEPAVLIHNAMTYTFPPCGLWQGPNDLEPRQYDGVLEIRDEYGTNPESIRLVRPSAKRVGVSAYKNLPKDRLIARAIDIGAHAETKLRNRGVVILTGDPVQDERMKKDAKEAWIRYRVNRAQNAIEAYRKRTSSFYADPRNVGQTPPRMTDFETSEQIWLDEYNDGAISGRKYVCKYKCGFQHDDKAVMARHVRVAHPVATDEERTAAALAGGSGAQLITTVKDTPPKPKRRGRPPRRVPEPEAAPAPA